MTNVKRGVKQGARERLEASRRTESFRDRGRGKPGVEEGEMKESVEEKTLKADSGLTSLSNLGAPPVRGLQSRGKEGRDHENEGGTPEERKPNREKSQ